MTKLTRSTVKSFKAQNTGCFRTPFRPTRQVNLPAAVVVPALNAAAPWPPKAWQPSRSPAYVATAEIDARRLEAIAFTFSFNSRDRLQWKVATENDSKPLSPQVTHPEKNMQRQP